MVFHLILNIFDYITDPNNQSSNPDEELISEHSENPELNVKAVKSLVDAQELAKASQAYKHSIEEFELLDLKVPSALARAHCKAQFEDSTM